MWSSYLWSHIRFFKHLQLLYLLIIWALVWNSLGDKSILMYLCLKSFGLLGEKTLGGKMWVVKCGKYVKSKSNRTCLNCIRPHCTFLNKRLHFGGFDWTHFSNGVITICQADGRSNSKIEVIFLKTFMMGNQWTFYSATSFLEKCRKVFLEKWFFKLGFFFWSTTFLQPEKMWIYSIKTPFFLVNHFSRTRFLEPDFSNHFSQTTFLQLSRKVVAE